MLVVVEDKAAATLALVAAEGVDAVLLAAAIILGALVLVCRGSKRGRMPGLRRAEARAVTPGEVGVLAGLPPPPGAGGGREADGLPHCGVQRSRPRGAQPWGEKGEVGAREA